MAARTTVCLCFLVLSPLCAGCAGGTNARVSVHISVKSAFTNHGKTQTFSLTCAPTGGTLPQAARVCSDIRQHPAAMLAPPPVRSICLGGLGEPNVEITAMTGGHTTTFGGSPGCDWPGGTTLGIYWAAANGNTHSLRLWEPLLRCDDAPDLLAKPTPWRSVFACTHGLWTTRSARLIVLAERAPQLAALDARALFPREIGARACTIRAGGPAPGRVLHATCGVSETRVWSTPIVTFVEAWPVGSRRTARTKWSVTLHAEHVTRVTQTGAVVPQLIP